MQRILFKKKVFKIIKISGKLKNRKFGLNRNKNKMWTNWYSMICWWHYGNNRKEKLPTEHPKNGEYNNEKLI